MKKALLITVVALAFFTIKHASAQEPSTFKTKKGNILLLFQLKNADSSVIARSKSLYAVFNYNVPHIRFRVNMNSFSSAYPGIEPALQKIVPEDMTFDGDMGINKISTNNNPHVIFPIEGLFKLNGESKYIKLSGNLFPVQQVNKYRAQLMVSTELVLSDFNLKQYFPEFRNRFYIEIYQSVLEPNS